MMKLRLHVAIGVVIIGSVFFIQCIMWKLQCGLWLVDTYPTEKFNFAQFNTLAFLFGYPSFYNAVLYTSVFLVNIGRLMREENILAADPAYRRYMHSVRGRLIPLIY